MPYRRLRIAMGIALVVTFVMTVVGTITDGRLASLGFWLLLTAAALALVLAAATISASRRV